MKTFVAVVGVLVVAMAAASGVLAQSSPFDGTWKLNPAESKYTSGKPPKEMTFTFTTVGDQTQVAGTGKSADGSPRQFKYVVPSKGGTGKYITGPADYNGVSRKIINDNTQEVSYLKDGKEIVHFTAVVSTDGKTMTLTSKETDAQGKSLTNVAVYDKQ
jgi:hypothetical protein